MQSAYRIKRNRDAEVPLRTTAFDITPVQQTIFAAPVSRALLTTPYKNRPSWETMRYFYPDASQTRHDFYPKISTWLGKNADNPAYINTCALRMSYALNKSGVRLGAPPSRGGSIKGNDGRNYWMRVKDLKAELNRRFKKPDVMITLPAFPVFDWTDAQLDQRMAFVQRNMLDKIANKRGIVVFEVKGWSDATGHFTLWDGTTQGQGLLYFGGSETKNDPNSPDYYFWMVPIFGGSAATQSVSFWELA